jgi:hypothetical protein
MFNIQYQECNDDEKKEIDDYCKKFKYNLTRITSVTDSLVVVFTSDSFNVVIFGGLNDIESIPLKGLTFDEVMSMIECRVVETSYYSFHFSRMRWKLTTIDYGARWISYKFLPSSSRLSVVLYADDNDGRRKVKPNKIYTEDELKKIFGEENVDIFVENENNEE